MRKLLLTFGLFFVFVFPAWADWVNDSPTSTNVCQSGSVIYRKQATSTHCIIYTYESGYYRKYDYTFGTTQDCSTHCVNTDAQGFSWDLDKDTNGCGMANHCFGVSACTNNMSGSVDTDSDGASDFCEITNGTMYYMCQSGNIGNCAPTPTPMPTATPTPTPTPTPGPEADNDSDGLSNGVEELFGTNPDVADSSVSGNYTTVHVDNYDPVPHSYVVAIPLTDDSYYILEDFTLPAMTPFGSPSSYTLADYGDLPDAVTPHLYEYVMFDGVPVYTDISPLSNAGTASGPNMDFTQTTLPTPSPAVPGETGIGQNATNSQNNSATAPQAWNNASRPSVPLPTPAVSPSPLDPKDIAQGVDLALNHVAVSSESDISEQADSELDVQLNPLQSSAGGIGATNYSAGDVPSSTPISGVTGSSGILHSLQSLISTPSFGQQCSLSITSFSFFGLNIPATDLNFDYAIIPIVRSIELWVFYWQCFFVFLKLTRWAFG